MTSSTTNSVQRLYQRSRFGMSMGLDRVRRALAHLGPNPIAWPVLHVAGTNGKGSVCAVCALALRRAGYRTGMFTSPHLHRVNERIQVDQRPIDDALLDHSLRWALNFDTSFFETLFVACIVAWREASIDCAVVEVGLGGRLDATNVIDRPACTCVTNVGLDHCDVLGHSLRQIAFEKASIAKPQCPMVLGSMPAEAFDEAKATATALGAWPVVKAAEQPWRPADDTGLKGAHQRQNALVAAALCFCASRSLPHLMQRHVDYAISNACWPGRLEQLSWKQAQVLFDGAHNVEGMTALVSYLLQSGALARQPMALVFGAMADKRYDEMLRLIAPLAASRYYVAPAGRRAASPEALASIAPGTVCTTTVDALELARRSADFVLVCGSLYLVAELRAHVLELAGDPIVAL